SLILSQPVQIHTRGMFRLKLIGKYPDPARRETYHTLVADVESDETRDHCREHQARAIKGDVGRRPGETDGSYRAFQEVILGERRSKGKHDLFGADGEPCVLVYRPESPKLHLLGKEAVLTGDGLEFRLNGF